MFQSTPGYEAGRFLEYETIHIEDYKFQSTPGYEAGRFAA